MSTSASPDLAPSTVSLPTDQDLVLKVIPMPGDCNANGDIFGGWVMAQDGFTPEAVSARLEAFLTAPETLTHAAENAKKLGHFDAAKRLADIILPANAGIQMDPRIKSENDKKKVAI